MNKELQLGNTISRNELTMMNAPKSHTCTWLPDYVKIEVEFTEGGLTWFMKFIEDIDFLGDNLIRILSCAWCPEQFIDYTIVNLRGENPTNEKGEYLCNGNCDWEGCNQARWICTECGYVVCDRCGEQFDTAMHQLLNLEDNGDSFCRGCLCLNTEVEY